MKPKKFTTASKWLLPLSLVVVGFISCQKEKSEASMQPKNFSEVNSISNTVKNKLTKIYAGNVSELYAAINDAANAGNTIVLAAGTNVLNAAYPNANKPG